MDLPYLSNLSSWDKQTESKNSLTTPNAKVELLRSAFDTEVYHTSLAQREKYLSEQIRNRETTQTEKNLYMALIDQQPTELVDESYLERVSEDIGLFHLAYEGFVGKINLEMRTLERCLSSELTTSKECAEDLDKSINGLLIDFGKELANWFIKSGYIKIPLQGLRLNKPPPEGGGGRKSWILVPGVRHTQFL